MRLRRGRKIQLIVGANATGTIEPPRGTRSVFVDKDKKIVHVRFDDGSRKTILRDLIKIVR